MAQFIGSKQFNLNQKMTLISDSNPTLTQQQQVRSEIVQKLQKFTDPAVLRLQRKKEAAEKYKKLLEEINLSDPERQEGYKMEQVMPFIHFYKLLAKKPSENHFSCTSTINRLKLWIPDTIILNDGEVTAWMYSDLQGFVFRSDQFTSKNVISKLANYTSPDELVAVVKKQNFRDMRLAGNEVKLVCCRDLPVTVGALFANKGELNVIQKFVKSNGPKAFICRTVWRKDKNPFAWIITNKTDFFKEDQKSEIHKYITNPRIQGSCTIVQTCRGKYVEETTPYIKNILTYLFIHLKITFLEFAADFIKDESGIWWFINVKGFILETCPNPLNMKPITHFGDEAPEDELQPEADKMKKSSVKALELCSKMCKYCEQLYSEQELQHKMTLKMVIQTDKHLYWRGKDFEWLSRSDVTNLDVSNLYQEHKVCKQCYHLYTETEKLIELESQFNRFLGVPVVEDTQYSMLTLKANQINNEPLKPTDGFNKDNEEQQQVFDISATKQLILPLNKAPFIKNTQIKQLNRFRFMVLLQNLRDIPQNIDMSKHYYLEYSVFEQKQRVRLDFSNSQLYDKGHFIQLNRLRLFYLFSQDRKGVSEYIKQQRVVTMYLYQENKKIGTLDLELQDFLSDRITRREFLKVFSGKDFPILSWGLNLTLGLADSGQVNVTRIKLQDHCGIYIPSCDYYSCEPLPPEWMTIINQKKDADMSTNRGKQTQMDRAQSSQTFKRVQIKETQNNLTYGLSYSQTALKSRFIEGGGETHQKDSLCDSTKELESQLNLQKEIQQYAIDEDDRNRRKKKRRARAVDDF